MAKFFAMEQAGSHRWCVVAEGNTLKIELKPPADMEQALRAAEFMTGNIRDIACVSGSVALENREGNVVTGRRHIEQTRISLLGPVVAED